MSIKCLVIYLLIDVCTSTIYLITYSMIDMCMFIIYEIILINVYLSTYLFAD